MGAHAGNAIWLFVSLPLWYFTATAVAFEGGVLTAVPAAGIVSLVAGGITAVVQGRLRRLWHFIVPVLISQCYVATAGFFRGQLHSGRLYSFVLWGFLVGQACLIGLLIYRSKGARTASSMFALFCLSYAAFATFVAGMAFADSWL
jgi:hypothetical protein